MNHTGSLQNPVAYLLYMKKDEFYFRFMTSLRRNSMRKSDVLFYFRIATKSSPLFHSSVFANVEWRMAISINGMIEDELDAAIVKRSIKTGFKWKWNVIILLKE